MSGFEKTEGAAEVAALKIANNDLAKRAAVAEQLLGHILLEVGEPVVINKADIKTGFPPGMDINIVDDGDVFRFEVVNAE